MLKRSLSFVGLNPGRWAFSLLSVIRSASLIRSLMEVQHCLYSILKCLAMQLEVKLNMQGLSKNKTKHQKYLLRTKMAETKSRLFIFLVLVVEKNVSLILWHFKNIYILISRSFCIGKQSLSHRYR